MVRRGDTKPLCHVAQASVALPGVSLLPLSGDKSLVLCRHGSPRTSRAFFSRPRRGSPFYVGLYRAGLLREPGGRDARRGRNGPGVVVQP
jgi:hypothetical protein